MDQNLDNLRPKTSNWKLANDAQLCSLLGDISKSLQERCEVMDKKLLDMKKNTIKLDCIVQNFNVELSLLANRKFIETVIQEDDALPNNTTKPTKPAVIDHHADTLAVLKESLVYAQQLANTISNPYDTDLPSIIGSEEWIASSSKTETPSVVETHLAAEPSSSGGSRIPPCPPPPPPLLMKQEEITNRQPVHAENIKPKPLNVPARKVSAQENKLHGGSLFDSDLSSDECGDSPKNDISRTANDAIRDNGTSAPSLRSEDDNSIEDKQPVLEEQPSGIPSLSDLMNATAKLKKINPTASIKTEIVKKQNESIGNGPLTEAVISSNVPIAKENKSNSRQEKSMLIKQTDASDRMPGQPSKPEPVANSMANTSSKSRPPVKSLFDSDSDDGDLFKPVFSGSTKSFTSTISAKSNIMGIPINAEKTVENKPHPNKVISQLTKPPRTLSQKTTVSTVMEKKLPPKVKSLFDSDSDTDDLLTSIAKTSKSSVTRPVIRESQIEESRVVAKSPETNISSHIDELPSSGDSGPIEIPKPLPAVCSIVTQPNPLSESSGPGQELTLEKETIPETVDPVDTVPPPPLLEDSSSKSESESTSEMSGKLNKSAFANMLNSKLAMGPPTVPGSRGSKTTDDATKKKEDDNIPGTAHSATLPRMGGLLRRPQHSEEAQPAAKLFEDNPKLLSCITKNRPKGPARRPPTKRPNDEVGVSKAETKTTPAPKDVSEIREKLSKLSTKDEKVVNSVVSPNGSKPVQPVVKKSKGLFDSESDEEAVETTPKSAPIKTSTVNSVAVKTSTVTIKTETPKSKTVSASVTVTATKPPATISTKPVKKSLFDDDSDEDLDLFRKKK